MDAKWIAGPDFPVRVWEVGTGRELRRLEGHTATVYADLSPDGQRVLAASGDKTRRVWDTQTGEQLLHVQGVEGFGFAAWSPDGKRCVSGSCDGTRARNHRIDNPLLQIEKPWKNACSGVRCTSRLTIYLTFLPRRRRTTMRKFLMSWEGKPYYRWVKTFRGVRYRACRRATGPIGPCANSTLLIR